MANLRKKSEYAAKQGRARKSAGDDHDGPRTRYAVTSPIAADHVTNPGHRLARYFARGEALERERLQRRQVAFDYETRPLRNLAGRA